jgi:Domain of unknown function (DUF4397)
MMKKNSINIFFALAILFTATMISCGVDDLASPAGRARVRLYHGVADAPGVQVSANGSLINLTKSFSNKIVNDSLLYKLSFPADSTYLGLEAGETTFSIAPIGGTTSLLEAKATLESGKSYSVFAVDSLARLGALVVADDFPAPVSKKANFRFVHLIPNAPAVDVIRVRGGIDTTILFTNVAYRSATTFTSVDTSVGTTGAFKTDYLVRLSSTKATVSSASLTGGAFANGRVYTLVATGFVGGTGSKVVARTLVTNSR